MIPEPYTPPYVSHIPDVHHIKLDKEDQFVILGSDGLWDYLSDEEAVQLVHQAKAKNQTCEQIAATLVERALAIAANESFMTLEQLYTLPPGRQRRGRHDDTTAIVLFF